ncbi:MAG: flagellar export protein FliJ [Epulopiscium sp.]|nr:flagellar export protein FliJ [Candidatus Epulonipiscium sp.]
MKFSFSLESLLQLRTQLEEQKQLEYQQVVQEWQQAQEQKQQWIRKQQKGFKKWRQQTKSKSTIAQWKKYNFYFQRLHQEIQKTTQFCIQLEQKVEIKRAELLEAVKQRKMIETLKEKAFEDFKKEEQRKEQQMVDELVTSRYYHHPS